MKKADLIFIIVFIFGVFLRFFMLSGESFRVDEATTALSIRKFSFAEVFSNTLFYRQILPGYLNSNVDYPAYYLLLDLWSTIFGVSEFSLRSFSAIFGSISIYLIFILAKELFDEKVGLISSLIFSLNVIIIERSQEARLYGFLTFIALSTAYYFIKSIKTESKKNIFILAVLNIIGMYTTPIFIYFFLFESSYLAYISFLDYKKLGKLKIKKIHIAFFVLIIAYIPLIPKMLSPSIEGSRFSGQMTVEKLGKIFLQYNSWVYPSSSMASKLNESQYAILNLSEVVLLFSVIVISIMLLAFFIYLLFHVKKYNRKDSSSVIFCLFFLIIPFIIFFITLYKVISVFPSNIYIIHTIPAYFILVSFSISKLKAKKQAIILSLLITLSIMPLISYYINPHYPQYRQAIGFLEEKYKANDAVILNLASLKIPFDYYSSIIKSDGAETLEGAKTLASGKNSVWLVLSTKYADPDGKIKSYFDENYRLLESKEFYDVKMYHYIK